MTQFWQLQNISRLVFPINVYQKMEEVKKSMSDFLGGVYSDDRSFVPLMDKITEKQEMASIAIRRELKINK